mgnify:CR=1 FL=1
MVVINGRGDDDLGVREAPGWPPKIDDRRLSGEACIDRKFMMVAVDRQDDPGRGEALREIGQRSAAV